MAWGTSGNVIQTNLDSDADDPNLARADIYAAFTELKAVIDGRGTTSGVASLDATGRVPAAQLPDNLTSSVGNNIVLSPDTGRVAVQDILYLTPKTVAELTALSALAGDVAYCSNGDGGSPCIAVYNGTDWKAVSLGSTISAT
jgi:hypothetical protein